MDNNFENIVNAMLEKVARGYANAKADWKADKRNPFKDGRFLAYYEAKETLMKCLNADSPVSQAVEEIKRRFDAAKADWKADKHNSFKDGKLLGYFEVLNDMPSFA